MWLFMTYLYLSLKSKLGIRDLVIVQRQFSRLDACWHMVKNFHQFNYAISLPTVYSILQYLTIFSVLGSSNYIWLN